MVKVLAHFGVSLGKAFVQVLECVRSMIAKSIGHKVTASVPVYRTFWRRCMIVMAIILMCFAWDFACSQGPSSSTLEDSLCNVFGTESNYYRAFAQAIYL